MNHRHLFLDLRDITRMEHVLRRVYTPQRYPENPILQGENDWERFASLYGTVLRDPQNGTFKMCYLTGPQKDGFVQIRGRCALAQTDAQPGKRSRLHGQQPDRRWTQ